MPIYEYQCQSCQHELEVIHKISAEPRKDCPACGQSELKKKVSAAAFRLKGGGWYETDFKTGDKKNIAGDTAPSKDAASAASGSSDGASKPAAAADSSSSTKPSVAG
jgi:putative FmdB family regulatory protein